MAMDVEQTLGRIRRFWTGEEPGPLLSICTEASYRQNPDEEAVIAGAARCIGEDLASGINTLPTFIPDFGTVSMPALWGGKRIAVSQGGSQGIHIEPIARTIDELDRLPEPATFEASDFGRALRLYRKVCERLGRDDIFLRTPDLQGPMNTLGLLCEQTELIMALYEAPELVDRLLTRITDVTIDYLQRYRAAAGPQKVIGNVWPWMALLDGKGIGITQDYMPLLGPELYARFELPQLKRIADAFGGVFIHCCGEYSQHLPALAKADFKIWGLEMHYPCTKLWDVHAALGPELAYMPYIAPTGSAKYPTIADFLQDLPEDTQVDARLWICVARDWLSAEKLAALQTWVERRRRLRGGR